jgi:hypothetical protein
LPPLLDEQFSKDEASERGIEADAGKRAADQGERDRAIETRIAARERVREIRNLSRLGAILRAGAASSGGGALCVGGPTCRFRGGVTAYGIRRRVASFRFWPWV